MNENKYVEANDLMKHLPNEPYKGAIRRVLQQAPAADVVEVVRCMDCKYYEQAKVNNKGFLICPASGMEITEADFCSYGERRTE